MRQPAFTKMTVFQYFVACSIVAGLLGVREAYRYRLLISPVAQLTTTLAMIGVLGWLGLVISAFFALPIGKALIVLVGPFIFGNLIRVSTSKLSGGKGFLSEEQCAEQEFKKRTIQIQRDFTDAGDSDPSNDQNL